MSQSFLQAYAERARQLMLTPVQRAAFVTLSVYADARRKCPSCGQPINRYESERVTHARLCKQLRSDVAAEGVN